MGGRIAGQVFAQVERNVEVERVATSPGNIDGHEALAQFQCRPEKLGGHRFLRSAKKERHQHAGRHGGKIDLGHILKIDQQYLLHTSLPPRAAVTTIVATLARRRPRVGLQLSGAQCNLALWPCNDGGVKW